MGDLVGAAGGLAAAHRTLHTGNGVLGFHTDKQLGNALQVAVAAALHLDRGDGVVGVQFDLGAAGADTLVFVSEG